MFDNSMMQMPLLPKLIWRCAEMGFEQFAKMRAICDTYFLGDVCNRVFA